MKSKTQVQLAEMHASHRQTDKTLDEHIEFLQSLSKTNKVLYNYISASISLFIAVFMFSRYFWNH